MDQEIYQQVREALHEAGDLSGDARTRFLAAQPDAVREEVMRLLGSDGVVTGELVPPVTTMAVPTAIGEYAIVREIGRGGMGTVYEAKHGSDRVALKVVQPHLAVMPRYIRRLEREARVGQEVIHENVVRTLGVDHDDGMHFLVLELVEGRSLRVLLQEWKTVPETLLREIARQVASGLAAIHAAGAVHRDLKPENILITNDQRVRIMDLGVAKVSEPSADLTQEGQFLGSLYYASPEQFEGIEVGPAADLYGLGVLLYEMATGENPFRHESPGEILHAHLEKIPPPARGVTPFFATLLGTLMAKDPAERIGSGADLEAILSEGEAGKWWTDREQERHVPSISVRRDATLQGRQEELAALHLAWSDVRAGHGKVVFLQGEAGLGKTRLIDSFLRAIAGDNMHILYGSYPPTGSQRGLTDAITGKFGRNRLDAAIAPYLTATESLVPAFAAYLRNEGASSMQGDSLRAMCCHLMRGLATERPTVWVIEDLHFAPEMGQSVARAMARATESCPVLLVVTSRKEFPGFRPLALSRLSEEEVIALVGDEEAGRRIARKSDGVPFFVFELMHAAAEGIEDVPSAVRDLIAARLHEVDGDQRAILDVAAAQGFEFDGDLVATALEMPVVTVLQDLVDIERRLELVRNAGRYYHFDHHLIQEVIYDEIPDPLREEYHMLLARCGGDAAFLAYHYFRGRRPEEGLPHLEEALAAFQSRFLNEKALDLMERSLPLLTGRRRAEILLRHADVTSLQGKDRTDRAAAEEALALAQGEGDAVLVARSHLSLVHYFTRIAEDQSAHEHMLQAAAFASHAGDKALQMKVQAQAGMLLMRKRRSMDAIEHMERARTMARELGDRRAEVRAMTNIGSCHRHRGEYGQARTALEAAADIAGEDQESLGHIDAGLALVCWHECAWEEAIGHYEARLRSAIAMGNRRSECSAVGNMALVYRELGELEESVRLSSRHRTLAREIGDRRSECVALINLGEMHLDLGDFETAHRFANAANELCEEIGFSTARGNALEMLGYHAQLTGDDGRAKHLFRSACELLTSIGDVHGETLLRLRLARLGSKDDLVKGRKLAEQHGQLAPTAIAAALDGEESDVLESAGLPLRMEAHFLLWQSGGDARHLRAAKTLLVYLREHAPPRYRGSMVGNHPLYSAIDTAS